MAATVWKGHLTFGLISVPVRLYAAARSESISFNQIHDKCGSRIRMRQHCPVCDQDVERSELKKGYEVEDGRFVLFDPEEIEAVAPPSARTMEVLEFVQLDDVDPVFFDASYYMTPENQAGEKPYYLLSRAMEELKVGAIARFVKANREHIVIVRPSQGGLMLHTLYYGDEVRAVSEYGHPEKVELQDKELEMGKMFVQSLAAGFDPSKYRDTYRENLEKMIAAKAAGQEFTVAAAPAAPPAMDLMAALKASLELGKRPPAEVVEEGAAESQAR